MNKAVAQLNHEGFFLYAVQTDDGMPGNAREEFPPPDAPLPKHHRWRWSDGEYTAVPDYRGQTVYRPDGTTYYPDTWGPLPEGDSLAAPPPPPPTLEEEQAAMQQAFTDAIQQRLDDFARTRNYDNIMSAATYATSTVPKFQTEGQYAVEARDATWATGYEILNSVLTGERPMPTLEEVFAELPVLEWPDEGAAA